MYGGSNRQDWRTLSVDMVGTSPKEVDRQLVPMLRGGLAPGRTELEAWTLRLVEECRDLVGTVLPLEEDEMAFLTRLNDGGEIVPQLLTEDSTEQRIIASHPGLLWKALNVRRHSGLHLVVGLGRLELPISRLSGGRAHNSESGEFSDFKAWRLEVFDVGTSGAEISQC